MLVAIKFPLTTSIKKWLYYAHKGTPVLHPLPRNTGVKGK